jgi:hypothetical protein
LKEENRGILLFKSRCQRFCKKVLLVNILPAGMLYIKVEVFEVDYVKEIL